MPASVSKALEFYTYFNFIVVEIHFALKSKVYFPFQREGWCVFFTVHPTVLKQKESKRFYQHLLYKRCPIYMTK